MTVVDMVEWLGSRMDEQGLYIFRRGAEVKLEFISDNYFGPMSVAPMPSFERAKAVMDALDKTLGEGWSESVYKIADDRKRSRLVIEAYYGLLRLTEFDRFDPVVEIELGGEAVPTYCFFNMDGVEEEQ